MKVILIDGPLPPAELGVGTRRLFLAPDERRGGMAAVHASALARAIRFHAPEVIFDNHVVFAAGLTCATSAITQALLAGIGGDAQIVHCSFGLPRLDEAMAGAVLRLQKDGKLVVASAPAFGAPVYPADLEGVLSVQGDARCGPGDWTSLKNAPTLAQFAAHAGHPDDRVRGASLAAAHFTGLLAARMGEGTDMVHYMHGHARFQGREQRSAAAPAREAAG